MAFEILTTTKKRLLIERKRIENGLVIGNLLKTLYKLAKRTTDIKIKARS